MSRKTKAGEASPQARSKGAAKPPKATIGSIAPPPLLSELILPPGEAELIGKLERTALRKDISDKDRSRELEKLSETPLNKDMNIQPMFGNIDFREFGSWNFEDIKIIDFFSWPDDLYIPTEANPRDYWFFATPPPGNRYALSWTNMTGGGSAFSRLETGRQFSLTAPQSFVEETKTEAGIGVWFTPPEGIWRVNMAAEILGYHRSQYQVPPLLPSVSGYANYKASYYICAFQYNPNTRNYTLLRPFKEISIYNARESGLVISSGRQRDYHFRSGDTGQSLWLTGGNRYLVSVIAQTHMDVNFWLSNQQVPDPDPIRKEIVLMWQSLVASVLRINVQPVWRFPIPPQL